MPTDHFDEGPTTSELDDLYDMLSGVSEDSVRIYVGLEDEDTIDDALGPAPAPEPEPEPAPEPETETEPEPTVRNRRLPEAIQDSLVEGEGSTTARPRRKPRRASVPSWDEIMFGGPR